MIDEEDLEIMKQEYGKLRENKEHIKSIDKDFFFDFVDYLIQKNKKLEKERDHYKTLYEKYSNAFIEGGKKLTEE